MSVVEWTEKKIQSYIDNELEESLTLDYKDSRSLGKSDRKKAEITKDVSAMANSAGGLLIYGISEYQDADRSHLPEKITPIDQTELSKEWLEQIISNIRPKIPDIKIYPVPVKSGFVYVVEIPQSSFGHQAKDKKYYKRYNFESVAMEDYELKDILTRRTEPKFDISFDWKLDESEPYSSQIITTLKNTGVVLVNYLCVHVYIPLIFFPEYTQLIAHKYLDDVKEIDGIEYFRTVITNKEHSYNHTHHGFGNTSYTKSDIASTYFDPLMPGLSLTGSVTVENTIHSQKADIAIFYKIHADNSKPKEGLQKLSNIPEAYITRETSTFQD